MPSLAALPVQGLSYISESCPEPNGCCLFFGQNREAAVSRLPQRDGGGDQGEAVLAQVGPELPWHQRRAGLTFLGVGNDAAVVSDAGP